MRTQQEVDEMIGKLRARQERMAQEAVEFMQYRFDPNVQHDDLPSALASLFDLNLRHGYLPSALTYLESWQKEKNLMDEQIAVLQWVIGKFEQFPGRT